MRIAIHQPNAVPWLGFFDKIRQVDGWVVLDHVQYTRGVTNRARILVNGAPLWLTIPIQHTGQDQPIADVRVADPGWWAEHRQTLQFAYGRSPYFREVLALLTPPKTDQLAEINLVRTVRILTALGLDPAIWRSSHYSFTQKKADLIQEVCTKFMHAEYLSGAGGRAYLDPDEMWRRAAIRVVFQEYQHPVYPQMKNSGPFVPGLSIIDALMNCGVAGTAALLGVA